MAHAHGCQHVLHDMTLPTNAMPSHACPHLRRNRGACSAKISVSVEKETTRSCYVYLAPPSCPPENL
eukprot:2112366-Prorocentrum_lima.AAC.1